MFQLIEDFLGQDWTMERPTEQQGLPLAEVNVLRKQMLDEHVLMNFNETR
jgi:hypothetical protein